MLKKFFKSRTNRIVGGVTAVGLTLGIILVVAGLGAFGGLLILGGIIGVGYLIYRACDTGAV